MRSLNTREEMNMEWATLLKPVRIRQKTSVSKMGNDGRSEFKKDFDTVCNCTGIRRLQDKAQVFPLEREDYARTRLTHSLEVMSIAESLGVEALNVIPNKKDFPPEVEKNLNDIPTILRVAALLHDMGNPPFGHLGEEIISDWFKINLPKLRIIENNQVIFSDTNAVHSVMVASILNDQMKGDFYNFEGNAQLLRLVSKLSNVVDENGMNLTYPVLATIIKYPKKSTEIGSTSGIESKKMGYMYSENELYSKINSELGLCGKRHPLVFLLEAADDIAYLTADIEDAHKKGMVSLLQFLDLLKNNSDDDFINGILLEHEKYEEQWDKTPIPEHDNYIMQRLRIFIKGKMISAVKDAFESNYQSIMGGGFDTELLSCSTANRLVNIIRRDIEKKYIFYSRNITRTKLQSYQIIDTLLNRFVPSVFNHKSVGDSDDRDTLTYSLISNNYRYVCEQQCKNKTFTDRENLYYRLSLVTDFVAGMTDTYAMDMYHLFIATNNIN